MKAGLPVGEFMCPIMFERVRPPRPVMKTEAGVTYVVQGDYELAVPNSAPFRKRFGIADQRKAIWGEQSEGRRPRCRG